MGQEVQVMLRGASLPLPWWVMSRRRHAEDSAGNGRTARSGQRQADGENDELGLG